MVWERLDRAVATTDWLEILPDTKVYHLDVTSSNHKPLWIVPDGMDCRQNRPFRFEQMWMTEKRLWVDNRSDVEGNIRCIWWAKNTEESGSVWVGINKME